MKRRNLAKLKTLRPIKKREKPFEYRLRAELWDRHAIRFVKLKPTWKGMPDRMAMGLRNWCLVEVKRDGETVSDAQVIMHNDIYELTGRSVITIFGSSTIESAIALVVRHLEGTRNR